MDLINIYLLLDIKEILRIPKGQVELRLTKGGKPILKNIKL